MIIVGDVLVREEVLTARFCCDLRVCKGACCVEGDAGAPVLPEEAEVMAEIQAELQPYLNEQGKAAIASQGPVVRGEGGLETPLVNNRECAYATFDADGTVKCGIEQAWADGKVDFQKPISCALYPIRVQENGPMPILHYHQWGICAGGRALGENDSIPLVEFLKAPLIRRFGEAFYEQLSAIARAYATEAN